MTPCSEQGPLRHLDDFEADQQVTATSNTRSLVVVPSHLHRPKSSPALMAARFVTIGLSNKAYSPGRIPPEAGLNLALGSVF